MKTTLFILIPHLSHYYPTFGLARCLQSRGFRVVYAGMDYLIIFNSFKNPQIIKF